ncbi:MAG: homocysteine S-methyltransferase family protein [Caldilineaceae bacterium]
MEPLYAEQAALLAWHVDLLLCETMSSAAEGRAVAVAACGRWQTGLVSWTLHEDRSGHLRSGETVAQAAAALADLPVSGYLVNCCAPESITNAMHELKATGASFSCRRLCQYVPTRTDRSRLDGDGETDGSGSAR